MILRKFGLKIVASLKEFHSSIPIQVLQLREAFSAPKDQIMFDSAQILDGNQRTGLKRVKSLFNDGLLHLLVPVKLRYPGNRPPLHLEV